MLVKLDVNTTLSPGQKAVGPDAVITGALVGVAITVALAVAVHPRLFVTVSVYVPGAVTDFVCPVPPPVRALRLQAIFFPTKPR